MKILSSAFFIPFLTVGLYAGGPWTQPAGGGYLQFSYTTIPEYVTLYSEAQESIRLDRKVTDQTFLAYLEYGLSEQYTLLLELPVKSVGISPDRGTPVIARDRTGLGNTAIALKRSFRSGLLQWAGQVSLESAAGSSAEEMQEGLLTGVDAWGVKPSVSVGASKGNAYAFLDTGIRFRNNDYSNEFLAIAEVGMSMLERLWVIAVLDWRESITTGSHDQIQTATGLYPDNQEYLSYGLKLIVAFTDRVGANFSSFGATGGNLVAKSPAMTAGLYLRW